MFSLKSFAAYVLWFSISITTLKPTEGSYIFS